jgi:hypothetical protein
MIGIGCCTCAASGHAAALPSTASNSRRPMVTVIRPSRARCVKGRIARARGCSLAVQTARGFGFNGKAQTEQLFSGLAPKADIERHDWHVRFVPGQQLATTYVNRCSQVKEDTLIRGNFQAVDYRPSLNSTVICRLSRNARGRRHPATQNNIKEANSSAYIVAEASDLFVV